MSDKFQNWQEVIVDFFESRVSQSKLFKARKYILDKNTEIEKEKDDKKIKKLQRIKS